MSHPPTEITALIVDDETLSRDVIRHSLKEHPRIRALGEYSNGNDALEAIRSLKPDLVFLDIKMPGLNGIALAKSIEGDACPAIIFVTAFNEFAIDAFERNAIDYLLKPFDQERFDRTIERASRRLDLKDEAAFARRLKAFLSDQEGPVLAPRSPGTEPPSPPLDRITVKEDGRIFFVETEQVEYLEATGNYVSLHVGKKSHLVHATLTRMERSLDPRRFLRIHRSTIVNVTFIKELQPHFNGEYIVLLQSGAELKLSRSFREAARQRFGLP